MADIPVGVSDFITIREFQMYYVDKTALIDGILGLKGTKVTLFSRPRGFGKTLNLSMLDAYLNMEYEANT